jgi:hypothetical protein
VASRKNGGRGQSRLSAWCPRPHPVTNVAVQTPGRIIGNLLDLVIVPSHRQRLFGVMAWVFTTTPQISSAPLSRVEGTPKGS